MNKVAGIIALTFLLVGCSTSSSGPRFQDSSFATQTVAVDKGRIIFYRESDWNFRSVTVGIDGTIVGALAHRQVIVADITPGEHKLSAWLRYTPVGEFTMNISVAAGETYYIRASRGDERMLYPKLGPIGTVLLFADTKGEFQLEAVPAVIASVDVEEFNLSE